MNDPYERVIAEDGHILAQNLAYHCIATVKDVIDALESHGVVPAGVDLTRASLVVLSIRAAVDLQAINAKYGKRAANLMLQALDKHYSATGLVTAAGGFTAWVAAARKTMAKHADPGDWVRAQCVALLDTRDPEDELFHLALVPGVTAGTPLSSAIEEAASRRN